MISLAAVLRSAEMQEERQVCYKLLVEKMQVPEFLGFHWSNVLEPQNGGFANALPTM